MEGTAARFQCQVTGNPEPDVEWYKDGRKLRESKQLTFLYDENDNCKLIITEGRQKDAGEYKVVAVNQHGKVSCSAKLIIKEHASSDEESGGEASDSEISDDATDDEKDVGIRSDSLNKHYKIKDELGKGRFGVVCKCSRITDGKGFAAKFIKCSKEQDKKDVKHEIEIMSVLRHRRLLRLADAFESPTEIVLVMELVTGGELFEKVVEDEFISENDVIHYMKQIIEGVQHMHSKEVLHLDLKPENIMIVRPASRQIKLIDFGLARKYNPKENLKVMFGTPEFVAPEVLTYDRITPATDMWSIGVIAYVLLSGLSPFMGDNDAETLANVQTAEWDFDDDVFDDISDDAREFISNLLVLKATNRITVEKCLKHPWLTEKRETGKRLKTDRLKAFTARRKWKKALTAIRSTNFLSRLMGSRGSSDGSKKSSEEGGGGGGGGLLARVKAMHSAGVQAPGSGPSSSPFLSPSSAEKAKPTAPTETTKSTGSSSKAPTTTTAPSVTKREPLAPKITTPSSKEPTTTTAPSVTKREPPAPKTTTPSSKEPITTSKPSSKTEAKDSAKTDSKATPSNKVPKVTDANDVSSKPTESNNNISNKEPEKASDRTKTPTPTTSPPKNTVNDTSKNSDSPASTRRAKVPTSRKGTPGKLPVWPPPPKERPQKRGRLNETF